MGSSKTLILRALLVIAYVTFVSTAVITVIDKFTPGVPPINVQNPNNTANTTKTAIANGNVTLGTERDQILTSLAGSTQPISTSITRGTWISSFQQGNSGFSTVQYDGIDGSGNLSLNTLGPLDLTSQDSASAFYIYVASDLDSNFIIKVYGPTPGTVLTANFAYHPPDPDAISYLEIPFSLFTGNASFKNVAAIELILNVQTIPDPVDVSVFQFGLVGYQASGFVFLDCNLNGILDVGESAYPGATATITDSNNKVINTLTTDSNGDFTFLGLANGTYKICITNSGGATPTIPNTGCRNLILTNGTDVSGLSFGFTITTFLFPPANVTIECGTCNTTDCTGIATGFGCSSAPQINSTDSVSSGKCPQIITRTFSAVGAVSVKQTITVQDTTAPDIVVTASDISVPCDNQVPTIANWVATHGGASATDCTGVIWSSNFTTGTPGQCSPFPVLFRASDPCGNNDTTLANYITTDSKAPLITTTAKNSQAQCDIVGNSDIAAFNTWLNNRAGADATDNCAVKASLKWTNDNGGFTIGQSCLVTRPVSFFVSDNCGNVNATSAIFTVLDTTKPVITKAAVGLTVNCSVDINAAFNAWTFSHASATASDNCAVAASLLWTPSTTVAPTGCTSNTNVTFTVVDPCGNNATTSAIFTVTGSNGPVFTTNPSPLTVNCSDPDSATTIQNWLDSHASAVATDLCTGTQLNWSNNFSSVASGGCKNISVAFTACNTCASSKCATAITTLTLNDQFPPTFVKLPQNVTSECSTTSTTDFNNWLQFYGNGQVTDDCTPPQNIKVTNNWPNGQVLPVGCGNGSGGGGNTANVTFVATDACSNHSPGQLAQFTIVDTTPPSISNAEDLSIECNSDAVNKNAYSTWISAHGNADGSDACSSITWTNNGTSTINATCFYSELVQFNATDNCGFVNSTFATFTISDTKPPVITTPAKGQNATCNSDFNTTLSTWLASHGGAAATDNCTTVTWTNNFVSLTGGCSLSALVKFTASDLCGHNDSTAATFSVVDTQAPVIITQAQSQTVACDFSAEETFVNFLNTHGGAVAHDACQPDSNLVWSYNLLSVPTTCGQVSVTFNVTDGCGSYTYTTATFTVTDKSPPVFNPRASDLDVECDGYGNTLDYSNWVASRGGAVAVDTCSLRLKWSNNAPAKGPVGCGHQEVTYTVGDTCNNFASTTATYTVYDDLAPAIFPQAEDLLVECDGKGNQADLNNWLASHANATAVDICYGNAITWRYARTAVYADVCTNYTEYTFYVSDQCGNTATTIATFGITDSFPPTITVPPNNLSLECGPTNEADIAEWLSSHADAQAVDACNTATWANDYVDEKLIGCYQLPVVFVAYDACLNVAFSSALLSIYDTQNPQFVNFPSDLTLPCDADINPINTGIPDVQDQCSSTYELLLTFNYTDSYVPIDPAVLCPGDLVITRTFSVTDLCGHTTKQNQILTIKLQRSSGDCPVDCPCNNPCCPQPDPQNCLQSNCLPQTCAPSFCAASLCTCPTVTRAIAAGDEPVEADPSDPSDLHPVPVGGSLPQCEPVYIFVNDDDHDPNGHENDHGRGDSVVVAHDLAQFTDRLPGENDKKEFRKTARKSKAARSILQSILALFF